MLLQIQKSVAGGIPSQLTGKEIKIYAKANAAELPMGRVSPGVDVVLECTGFYTSKDKLKLISMQVLNTLSFPLRLKRL